ncbi:MAG TPA: UTRA domain-containing protein [Thermodesulfobacteriota bacterium]
MRVLIVRVEERVRAVECSAEDSRLLGLPAGTPILEVERTACGLDSTPIEWRTMRCHTGRLHYFNEIR